MFLIGTSVVLGLFLGAMALFIFNLPAIVSFGIAVVAMMGLFFICIVLNSITFKQPKE